ncbi:hypothetical protein HHK36_011093 [Tetracentron sinense]|uniref:Uncharacterized protein n=1 Tax=Tetracentron sinense TaxID=13715 RepID=A0A834Z7F9_TETSI|nr:hypothetical protein HHK36_011093 [Tetracentron sinense]
MSMSKLYMLWVLLLMIAALSHKARGVEARPLPLLDQQRYTKLIATLGIVCKCCDGVGDECTNLFGAKDSSSSMGIFGSVFPPASTVLPSTYYHFLWVVGRDSSCSEVLGSLRKQNSRNQVWNTKNGAPDNIAQSSEGESLSNPNKDRSSIYQSERVEPCYLSSSLYYGGQDIYSHSPNTRTSGSHPIFKKDGGEDDPNGSNLHSASRGNWWQGMIVVEGHSITKTLPPNACQFSIYALRNSQSRGSTAICLCNMEDR